MKFYELTQEDINVVWSEYVRVTGAKNFRTPSLHEVKKPLLEWKIYEQRQLCGGLPDSKLETRRQPNGDIYFNLNPNQIEDTGFSTQCRAEFMDFARKYEESRTQRGLPK